MVTLSIAFDAAPLVPEAPAVAADPEEPPAAGLEVVLEPEDEEQPANITSAAAAASARAPILIPRARGRGLGAGQFGIRVSVVGR
jgi:hypothetical protein